jgi:hypothetical protein
MPVAIHEAAHAVALHHFEIQLSSIKIYPAEGCQPNEGKTTCHDTVALYSLCDEDQAVIILAGFTADCHHDACTADWRECRSSNEYASDSRKLDVILKRCLPVDHCEDDDEIIDRPIENWLARTKRLVADPAYWRAITALAGRLDTAHHMTGKDATAIICQQLGVPSSG